MLAHIDCRDHGKGFAYCHVIDDVEDVQGSVLFPDMVMIYELDNSVWVADKADIIDLTEEMVIKEVGQNIYKIRLEGLDNG